MAFVLVGSGGTAISGTSSSTLALTTTADLSLANSRFCVLAVTSDNISTTDGLKTVPTDHLSVTGGTGDWEWLGEFTNANGAAAAGVTTSLWFFLPSGANAIGTVFTITFASAVVDKSAQIRRFTWDTTKGVRAAATPVGFGVDASNGFGSGALSGLPSQQYLFVAGLGKEANTTTVLTPSAGWGTWSVARSRNNAAAIVNWGEHLISTATGATSNPTLAVSGDTASLIAALEEYSPGITGTIGGTETGADAASVAGDIPVQGSTAATEGAADVAALNGKVLAQGVLAASEASGDTASLGGVVAEPGASGNLAANEVGDDGAAVAGAVAWPGIAGALATAETGGDSAAMSGNIAVAGALAGNEAGSDSATLAGLVSVRGSAAGAETGADSAVVTGGVIVRGAVAATEVGSDTAAIVGAVPVRGAFAASEVGQDSAAILGSGATPAIVGAVAASESGSDVVAASGTVLIAGALTGLETGPDGASFGGLVLIRGGLSAIETGADTGALSSAAIRYSTATGNRPVVINSGQREIQLSPTRPATGLARRPVQKSGQRPRSISMGAR